MILKRISVSFAVAMIFSTFWAQSGHTQLFSLNTADYYVHSAENSCRGIALDVSGVVYVAGFTRSQAFPCRNAYQPSFSGRVDAFVAGLSSSGSALLYATYLGGSGEDKAYGISVDSQGRAVVSGVTSSRDFPCRGAYQAEPGGKLDAFVAKVSSSGSELIFATYLGGKKDDAALDLALGPSGSVYVSGETFSADFPTRDPYQASRAGWEQDIFLTRLTSTGSGVIFSTYLGGTEVDFGGSLDLDSGGSTYVAGSTWSEDFPTLGAYSVKKSGKYDAFVSKFKSSGSSLSYSTYLGGEGIDFAHDLAVDREGGAWVTGFTLGEGFPELAPLYRREDEDGTAFLTRLSSSGSFLSFSTCWGTPGGERGLAIGLDRSGGVYITGQTGSPNFPLRNPFQSRMGGEGDVFIAKLSPATSAIVYSTYLGGNEIDLPHGIAVSSSGNAYVAGFTRSFDFPLRCPLHRIKPGGSDGFITGFSSSGSSFIFSTYLGGK